MAEKRTLLITGASSGIGAATARAAHKNGYRLALGARSVGKLEALARELDAPESLLVGELDVTDEVSVAAFVERAHDRFGRIDALFANAGIGGLPGGFSSAPIASWRRIIETNVLGLAISVQKALPYVKERRGHVLITGSVAGRRHLAGSMYSVSKWAANAFAYNLREELRGSGVRVTLIEPGIVDTPFFDTPKSDALRAEDVAQTVLFALNAPPSVDVHDLLVLPTPPLVS